MSLKEYLQKRKFTKTPEPKPKQKRLRPNRPLKFVIQKHAATRTHYDFRLELHDVLKSWAVPKGPTLRAQDPRLAIQVEDHPLEYGKFEGVIPKGNYGAGTVMIWDSGTYQERNSKNVSQSIEALDKGLSLGHLTFILKGKKLRGEFALVKLKKRNISKNTWLLIKKYDNETSRSDILLQDQSVKTGRTMEKIKEQAEKKNEIWLPQKVKLLNKKKQPPTPLKNPPLTHLNKIFWPKEGYTKGELLSYYDKIASYILPYLIDRPQSLHRQPHGISNFGFFQKDVVGFLPRQLKTIRIYSQSSKKTINYALIQNKWSLLYLINLGCIELHPWLSKVHNLDRPEIVVIDIDPDGNDFKEVIQVARTFYKVLNEIGAKSFCKTSGATGLHICIPTQGRFSYEKTRAFAQALCVVIHRKLPLITSIERNPARRRKRIYLDFLQNRRGQTLAAPYCVRPRPKATVSAPLKWSELKSGLTPEAFTIKTMPKRLSRVGDLWKPLLNVKVDIEKCMKKLSKQYVL